MLQAEVESERAIHDLSSLHRKLRHHAVLIFDLDGQLVMRQYIVRPAKDRGQFACEQTVIDIIMYPRLQQAGLERAPCAAAVDEVLLDSSNLGDMKVNGYG